MSDERRVLALDPGERRVGIAISDPLGITAQGLETFDRRTGEVVEHVRDLVARYDVERIVVGHPRSLAGRDTDATRAAEALAAALHEALGLPVEFWDERLSSVEAARTLRGARAVRGTVDRIAAVLILQGYLDSRANRSGEDPSES